MIPELPLHIWEIILKISGPLSLAPFVSLKTYDVAAMRLQEATRRVARLRARPPWISGSRVLIWRPAHSRWKHGDLIAWSLPGVSQLWVIRIASASVCSLQYIFVTESTIFYYK